MGKKTNKIKSLILSGMLAVTSIAGSAAAGSFAAAAPSLSASAADNDNYAKLLQYSLYFYDANMCGDVSGCGLSWRGNCHTSDEVPGGFHDAGDHAMFGLPQGYTASTLEWAYYEFPDAFDETGQTDHLKMITDHFAEFFKASTKLNGDTVTNFLYQKGDGTVDHSYWGPPETQGNREMFWTSNGASEIAAEYAAALAAHYKNFGNAEDLKYAKALYKFSTQYNQASPNQFYGSNTVADDQAWAAGWLYIATGDNSYLNASKNFPEVGWAHGWNDTHLGAACLYGENANSWSAANGYISSKANGSGYMFLDKWGSARLNCSMQMTALIATKHGAGDYKDWAKGQMNYILGQNPANTCFVTGFASNSAKNAHHRAASGYTSYSQFDMNNWDPNGDHMNPFCQYGSNSHTLIGALVGGPCTANGDYHDNMADYVCNEVAIDYNAGLVGAAAGLYHFYKTGSTVSNIEGVTKIYSGSSQPQTTTAQTTTTIQGQTTTTSSSQNQQNPVTTTSTVQSGSNNEYTIKPNQKVVYDQNADDKMIGWDWEDFNIPDGAKVSKVEVNISANSNIGKWEGAFGTSTTDAASSYWWMSDNMSQQVNGNSATITWTVPSDVANIISYHYGGQLKFGTWWIDSGEFTVDSIKVYTTGGAQTTTTRATTTTQTTTTTKPITYTTTTTAQITGGNTLLGDANLDGYVTVADAVAILQHVALQDKYGLKGQALINADCCNPGDGVTAKDALSIQKLDARVIKQLPDYA